MIQSVCFAWGEEGKNSNVNHSFVQDDKDYDHLVNMVPRNEKAYYNRGLIYYKIKKYHLAIEDFSKAIELNQRYEEAYLAIGKVYFDTNQFDKALQKYSQTIKINKNNFGAYIYRSNLFRCDELSS